MPLTLALCALTLTQFPPTPTPTNAQLQRAQNLTPLKRSLDGMTRGFRGRIGYHLIALRTGRTIGFRDQERFPSASTIKTSVMVEAIRQVDAGKLKWTDKRPLPPANGRSSSMWSYFFRDTTQLDMDGWVNLMIGVSDNTATLVMQEWLTSEAINRTMVDLGLPNTSIHPRQTNDPLLRRRREMFGWGMTTPREMARLLELIATGKAASPAGCEKMVRILGKQYWDDWIGGTVPPGIRVASKSGAISRSRSDTAIVYGPNPYILTIFTDSQKDRRWVPDNEGDVLLVRIAEKVWNYLHPDLPYRAPEGSKRFAPTGGGVEDS